MNPYLRSPFRARNILFMSQPRPLWKQLRQRLADHLRPDSAPDPVRRPRRFEALEPRVMLHGEGLPEHDLTEHVHHQLMIFIEGDLVEIPESIGVQQPSGNIINNPHTHEADGRLHVHPLGGGPPNDFTTVGDFFDVWRTGAGAAGNNSKAIFNEQQVLRNFAGDSHVIRMFVNGELNDEFEDYEMHDGDEIVIRYDSLENAGSPVFGALTNPIVTFNTNFGPIPIELYANDTTGAEATPGTVDNFLNYINDGDFIDSFFHRLIPGFVLQGGGFTAPKVAPTSPADFITPVPTDPTIQNEFSNSNIRTTVAMAKVGGDPNSATSGWFVNLADNGGEDPAGLDKQNGGFTAFGRVLNMTAVETIAGLNISNLPEIFDTKDPRFAAFTTLPHSGTLASGGELVVVQSIDGMADLRGTKFDDANGNGVRNTGEAGLAGFTIYLDANNNGQLDEGEISTVTGSDGSYRLSAPLGEYAIREVQQPGFIQSTPTSPNFYLVTVDISDIGREILNFNFGNMLEVVIDPPSEIDLLAATDSGQSDTDNLTNFNNASNSTELQFRVSGVESGAVVQVFSGGEILGQNTASSNIVTITTKKDQLTLSEGIHSFTARQVIDGLESDMSPALTITIDTTADGFTNTPPLVVNAGGSYAHDVEHEEEGNTAFQYSLGDAPDGMTIGTSTGQIAWTPTSGQFGPNDVVVLAIDQAGNVGEQEFTIEVNSAPEIDPIDPVSVDEGSLLSLLIPVSDPNLPNDVLKFALEGVVPDGATLDPSSGVFTWTPTEAQGPGSFELTVRVTDQGGLSDTATFMIDVNEVNNPPSLESIDSQTVESGLLVAFTASASDPDLPAGDLTFSLAPGAPDGAEIDPATGEFTWTPTTEQGDQIHSIGIRVADEDGLEDEQTVDITVLKENEAPSFESIDPFTIDEDEELAFTALASDPNGDLDTLAFSLASGAPAGATIDPFSGEFSWMPTEADGPGTFDVTVVVEDALGQTDEATFSVEVSEVNQTPVLEPIMDRTVTEGNTVELTAEANDPDLPAQDIQFSLDPGAPVGSTIDTESGEFHWTPPRGTRGTFDITIRATDVADSPLSTTETFSIKVVADVSVFAFADSLALRTSDLGPSVPPFFPLPAVVPLPSAGSGVMSQVRSESLARQLAIRSIEAAQRNENIGSGRRWIMPATSNSDGNGNVQPDIDDDSQDSNQPVEGDPEDIHSDGPLDDEQAQAPSDLPENLAGSAVDQAILEMAFEETPS